MFFIYLITTILGLIFAGFFAYFFIFLARDNQGDLKIGRALKGIGLGVVGLIVAVYSIRQIFRPVPMKDWSHSPPTM